MMSYDTSASDPERLATAISTLLDRFKVGPQGTAYDALSLTDTAIVARLGQAQAARHLVIQKDVGEALHLPKTTMTSAVKRLVARGLIARGTGADARARVLRLTAEGAALAQALRRAQVAASAQMLASLPSPERTLLLSLLERIAGGDPGDATAQTGC